MSIRYKFKQAKQLISLLSPQDLKLVKAICLDIHKKEKALLRKAEQNLNRCYHSCEGLCCKNIQIDTILSHWDFFYLFIQTNGVDQKLVKCLENENRLFSADCIFLKDGVGPCLFPDGIRPEICIVSFCTETQSIDPEVKKVKRCFLKLTWTVNFLLMRTKLKKMMGLQP